MSLRPRVIRIDRDEDDRHDDPHRQDRRADARVEDDQLVGRRRRRALRCPDDVRRRELERAVDEADRERAGVAGRSLLGERRDEDEGDDVEDDDAADEQEPARGQAAAALGLRRWGLGDLRGHDLLARHACSTHRSAASRRARILHRRARSDRLIERLQEPVDQPDDHQGPGTCAEKEADDHEEGQGPELLVDPVADEALRSASSPGVRRRSPRRGRDSPNPGRARSWAT